jgi:hypothetical protein
LATWEVLLTQEVRDWLAGLVKEDAESARLVRASIRVLTSDGPGLGRPLVDTVKGSKIRNLKELRPGSAGRSEIRILFVFDPRRRAVLLTAGDKRGDWKGWYVKAIKQAERLYAEHLDAMKEGSG